MSMRRNTQASKSGRWPLLALAGVSLAAIPLAAAARQRRRGVDPDSAPGYTARRNFGEYRVVGRSVTIARPRAELFAFWRDFRNLPRFMANLERIEPSGEEPGHATWHIRAPGGRVYAVIDAVGMEAHGFAIDNMLDIAKQTVGIGADRASALKQAILAVRPGGRVSVPGVYGGMTDKFPLGALMEKGLQIRTGQTHVQRYMQDLLAKIEEGALDTTFLISHRLPLEEAADGYKHFKEEQDSWTKVVLKPGG